MPSICQSQSFGEIHLDHSSFVINQVVQISVAEIKTRPLNPRSPYVGLRRFEEGQKEYFYGRDQLVAQLMLLVRDRSLVLVAGPSGSGKSSLVRAGLIPQLEKFLPQGRFRPLVLTPDHDPFLSLRGALLGAQLSQQRTEEVRADSKQPLAEVIRSLCPQEDLWLLCIDQFEELFTRCSDRRTQVRFVEALVDLARAGQDRIKVLLGMRSDFFDKLSAFPELSKLVEQGLCLVTDMQASELRAAIEEPAAQHGVVFEAGLVEMIIKDVQGRAGALPLLQYTLDLLWKEDQPETDRTLNTATYQRIGGVEGALRQRADTIYRYADADHQQHRSRVEQEQLRHIFLRLVDFSAPGTEARAVSKRALASEYKSTQEQRLIQDLVAEKLLVSGATVEFGKHHATVEVGHEALLSAWPQLREWLEQGREVIYLHNRLRADAQQWAVAGGKADEELWSGSRLQRAKEMREQGEFASVLGGLTKEEEAFLNASVALRERRALERMRRLQGLFALLSLFLLVVSGVAIYATSQKRKANRQQRAAVEARQEADTQKDLAVQRELDSYVEQGRVLLVENDQPIEALLWLQRAYMRGSRSPALPYLLADAVRSVDSIQSILRGHAGEVLSASYSPDGRRVVTASTDNTAKVWDAANGELLLTLLGHTGVVHSASFSPDGGSILTASVDGTARLWNAVTGEAHEPLVMSPWNVSSASFSPDGRSILTASEDGNARLWDSTTGRLLLPALKGHTKPLQCAKFSLDGQRIVTTSQDMTARLWDSVTGTLLASLEGHLGAVRDASFSPDGHIVTVSEDRAVRLWHGQTGKPLFTPFRAPAVGLSAEFSPDGRYIVVASWDKVAQVWRSDGRGLWLSLKGHTDLIHSARFSSDGQRIVTAGLDRTARIWDIESGRLLRSLYGHSASVYDAKFSPNGRYIVTASLDRTARIWNVGKDSRLLATARGNVVGFSSNGQRIITAEFAEGTAQVRDRWTNRALGLLKGPPSGGISSASFSPDGRRVVTTGRSDKTARVWDAESGRQLYSLSGHTKSILSARFSPDGRRIVTAGMDNTARVWDAESGRQLCLLSGHTKSILSAIFSRDGRRIVTAGMDNTARVWDAESGRQFLSPLRGHAASVLSASFSSDGRRIVTFGADKAAHVWDSETGKLLISPTDRRAPAFNFSLDGRLIVAVRLGPQSQVWEYKTGTLVIRNSDVELGFSSEGSASFSPDGRRMLTAGAYSPVRIWDSASGALLGSLPTYDGLASFSPDGRQIVTSNSNEMSIWDVSPETRSPHELALLLRCRLTIGFDGVVQVPTEPDKAACAELERLSQGGRPIKR